MATSQAFHTKPRFCATFNFLYWLLWKLKQNLPYFWNTHCTYQIDIFTFIDSSSSTFKYTTVTVLSRWNISKWYQQLLICHALCGFGEKITNIMMIWKTGPDSLHSGAQCLPIAFCFPSLDSYYSCPKVRWP